MRHSKLLHQSPELSTFLPPTASWRERYHRHGTIASCKLEGQPSAQGVSHQVRLVQVEGIEPSLQKVGKPLDAMAVDWNRIASHVARKVEWENSVLLLKCRQDWPPNIRTE